MPTTANYSWPTPADTDLVKDGAEAIRDLGNAIDSTVFANSPGLVHINTTTMSAVASQSVNDVFSATYKNYRIVFNLTGSSASSAELRFRVRVSGTDLSSSYGGSNKFMAFNTTTTFDVATSPTDRVNLGYVPNGTDGRYTGTIDIMNPFELQRTGITGIATGTNTGAYRGFGINGAVVDNATSYTGFSIFPTAGNLTGTVQVFGYKD
jgi:hypothetical protein